MKNIYLLSGVISVAVILMSSGTLDLANLLDYANQGYPNYITEDNTNSNPITDEGATLGRVLFYDVNLSSNNTISCASCHQQQFAFGDPAVTSTGVNGTTGRHSTRLINARFGEEEAFFWDKRAATLEIQTTMPIQDHNEMGFSGSGGAPDFADLITKLDAIAYYEDLFYLAFGDTNITEERIQKALAQFIRSIQSFDSEFDTAYAANGNNFNSNFSLFTNEENNGKDLYRQNVNFDGAGNRVGGGLGCNSCHRAPEFDIAPNSRNNGVTSAIGGGTDLTNERNPSLRDMFNASGVEHGPFMHDGSSATFSDVLDHYDDITNNSNLDNRLKDGNIGQKLNMTSTERAEITAFMKTLTGTAVYTDTRWSDPFDAGGSLTITNSPLPVELISFTCKQGEKEVVLKWITSSEINNNYFSIEKSLPGGNWEEIGTVDGSGTSFEQLDYYFVDDYPESGLQFYRLKQVDFDGQSALSDVVIVDFRTTTNLELNLFPNPTVNTVFLKSSEIDFENADIKVFNLFGQEMNVEKYVDAEQVEFDVNHLAKGVYFLHLNVGREQEVIQFLKD